MVNILLYRKRVYRYGCRAIIVVFCLLSCKQLLERTRVLVTGGPQLYVTTNRRGCTNAFEDNVLKPNDCSTFSAYNTTSEVYVFIHAIQSVHLPPILMDMLLNLESSGLLEIARQVEICLSGKNLDGMDESLSGFKDHLTSGRLKVFHVSKDVSTFEFPTINRIVRQSREVANKGTVAHVLYIHTKGLYSKSSSFIPKWFWRKTMEFWLVEQHKRCRSMLDYGYDTVGINLLRGHLKRKTISSVDGNMVHYSGNFWWSTTAHLARLTTLDSVLPQMQTEERLKAEDFILSALPNVCAGVLYSWGHAHMYNSHEIPSFHRMRHTPARCDMA